MIIGCDTSASVHTLINMAETKQIGLYRPSVLRDLK
jgi:hypothetical protein